MTNPLILRCNADAVGIASKEGPEGEGNAGARASRHAFGVSMRDVGGIPLLLLIVTILFHVSAAFAVQPGEQLSDPTLEARAREISAGLRCLVCQNQSIDDSDAPLAHDLRLLVRQRLEAGDSDEQVRDYLVARYGDFILLKPPFAWRTLLLWLTPVLVLAIGAAAAFRRSRRTASAGETLTRSEEETLARILRDSG